MVDLKALISAVDCDLWLYDGSTKTPVHFDKVLNNKHVVLFISDLSIKRYISKMKKIYEGIVMTDVVTIWLPIVKWTDKRESFFVSRLNDIPWYTVMYFSPLAGLKTIKEEWNFVGAPLVVVMNQQGNVLSKHGLDQLPEFLDFVEGEKAGAQRTKQVLSKSDGRITEVLKALLGKDSLRLPDGGSTKKKVKRLKDKYVVLFILCLDEKHYAIKQIKAVSAGIVKDQVNVVLILMGEERTDDLTQKMKELQSDITCYTVQSQLPEAGIKLIQDHWYFQKSPMVVMMNPQAEVLSKRKFNLEPIGRLTKPPPKEEPVYFLQWGSGFCYWNNRFSRIAKAVAADNVLKEANVCIKYTDNGNLTDNYKYGEAKWALLTRNERTICKGPKILNVLEAFDKWKGNLTLEPFEHCFTDYFNELS